MGRNTRNIDVVTRENHVIIIMGVDKNGQCFKFEMYLCIQLSIFMNK